MSEASPLDAFRRQIGATIDLVNTYDFTAIMKPVARRLADPGAEEAVAKIDNPAAWIVGHAWGPNTRARAASLAKARAILTHFTTPEDAGR